MRKKQDDVADPYVKGLELLAFVIISIVLELLPFPDQVEPILSPLKIVWYFIIGVVVYYWIKDLRKYVSSMQRVTIPSNTDVDSILESQDDENVDEI
ncbi:MAG: hypothetical protein RTU92_14770 [Candidatus Thorarchaeota archaeon]